MSISPTPTPHTILISVRCDSCASVETRNRPWTVPRPSPSEISRGRSSHPPTSWQAHVAPYRRRPPTAAHAGGWVDDPFPVLGGNGRFGWRWGWETRGRQPLTNIRFPRVRAALHGLFDNVLLPPFSRRVRRQGSECGNIESPGGCCDRGVVFFSCKNLYLQILFTYRYKAFFSKTELFDWAWERNGKKMQNVSIF